MFNLYWLINNPNVEGKIAGELVDVVPDSLEDH